jgi:hypothetical protein
VHVTPEPSCGQMRPVHCLPLGEPFVGEELDAERGAGRGDGLEAPRLVDADLVVVGAGVGGGVRRVVERVQHLPAELDLGLGVDGEEHRCLRHRAARPPRRGCLVRPADGRAGEGRRVGGGAGREAADRRPRVALPRVGEDVLAVEADGPVGPVRRVRDLRAGRRRQGETPDDCCCGENGPLDPGHDCLPVLLTGGSITPGEVLPPAGVLPEFPSVNPPSMLAPDRDEIWASSPFAHTYPSVGTRQ